MKLKLFLIATLCLFTACNPDAPIVVTQVIKNQGSDSTHLYTVVVSGPSTDPFPIDNAFDTNVLYQVGDTILR